MNRLRLSNRVIVAVAGAALLAACISSCAENRNGFGKNTPEFEKDASAGDAPDCRLQCSLDGRSVIELCTGRVVEECRPGLACGAGVCMEPCAAAAADRSSNGCEFYFQPPSYSPSYPPLCYASFLVNTSREPLEFSLELDGKLLDVSRAMFRTNPGSADLVEHTGPIAPGESVILFLSDASPTVPRVRNSVNCPTGVVPAALLEKVVSGTTIGSSFRLKTNVPVSLAAMYPFGGARSYVPSATLLLPVPSWSKENIIVNGWEASDIGTPGAQIIASEDDTEVTILPTRDIQNGTGVEGGGAGRPAKYRLSKGQYLQLVQDEELSGSIVTSTKPAAVFGGHSCANVPTLAAACDTLGQQIPAFAQWGSEYVGVGYRPRLGNEHEIMPYRIVAARDGTELDYDPAIPAGAPTTMNAGEVATFYAGTGDAFVVRTQDVEHPIYVAAYMTGGAGGGFAKAMASRGDPEFVNVVPAKQYLNSYSFYADPTYADTSLVVVRTKSGADFKDVWLECAGNLSGWKPIGERGEYEFVRVDLARRDGKGQVVGTCQNGLQRMKSEGPFTATLWGWDVYASYAYPGGMAQRKLVETPLSPVN